MLSSVKSPSPFLLRAFAVIICFLSLLPARAGRSFAVSMDPADTATFAAAAEQNAKLKSDLTWTFGAKLQRGWSLYTPLIQRLLNTEAAPGTNAFPPSPKLGSSAPAASSHLPYLISGFEPAVDPSAGCGLMLVSGISCICGPPPLDAPPNLIASSTTVVLVRDQTL